MNMSPPLALEYVAVQPLTISGMSLRARLPPDDSAWIMKVAAVESVKFRSHPAVE